MPLVLANRVQETGTANTTVSFTLSGAVAGFQSFAVIGNTNTTYYSATDGSGNWEVGLGTYSTTGPTLARTTVYASSNSGSAVTFSGAVNVFVTYPSGRSVNLDASGNVSALGTVSSGTWQGSTVGVAYGGTGVTTSSGANSVVLRDANENITVNRISQGLQTITASGGVTTLTAASDFNQQLVGTGGHTFRLPDATTLTDTTTFQFNNNATGTLTIENNAATTVGTVAPGGAAGIALMNNATSGGTWDVHGYIPENVSWGTNALYLNSTVVSGGTWQGGTIQPAYGGTGLTTFTTNGAVYATGTTTLTSGTLPVIAGGTGATATPTNGQLLIGNGTNYSVASLGTGTGISTSVGSGTLTINNTGVTSLAGTSPVTASASTGSVTVSLASGYGDTQNPYASKTANFILAAPNGSAGVPTFRAVVAADIPTLNQNTTGSAGSVANAVTFNNGGTGDASGTTFNGSAARTISYNTVGAPSTGGANATGTWGISISGNAATATTASNVNNGTLSLGVSGTGLSGSQTFTANQAGNATFTVASNATNLNTASTIVARDASGNFSAGTITATLSGSATSAGSVSNSLTLATSGTGLSGSATFNGSSAQTFTVASNATSSNTASTIVARDASGNFSAGTVTGTNFADAIGTYNVNLGSGGIEGRGAVAGYSGGSYGGIGYNVRHTTTGGQYIAPLSDTSNYLLFSQGFTFLGAGSGSAGRTLSYTTLATINSSGAFNTLGAITQNGSQVLTAGNYNSYAPTLTGTGASGTWGINITGNAATATTASNVNNGTLTMNVSGTGLSGSQTFTANQSGNATFTVTSNATNANTVSTIVARDASGNFSAGTITAALSGNASTATSATSATTATNIAGGAANRIPYNTGSGATAFIVAPTTASTFLSWNGSAFAWSASSAALARAWVNFNGTGTVSIRASGNVSSITDNNVGDYTVNFTTAIQDANYATVLGGYNATNAYNVIQVNSATAPTASAVRIASITQQSGVPTATDVAYVNVAILR
jgi:hypothetical protein